MDLDELHEECGVFGVFTTDRKHVAKDAILYGLYALQHRGQEGGGMVTIDTHTGQFNMHRGMGLVPAVFTEENIKHLKGSIGIGHARYSTVGSSTASNAQPFVLETQHGHIAVCHNGQLTKGPSLRRKLMQEGVGLYTESDSEVLAQYLARSGDPVARIRSLMKETDGAYSVIVTTSHDMIAFRDPLGMRPLCIGRSKDALIQYIASESCAIYAVGGTFLRELEPGEIVRFTKDGMETFLLDESEKRTPAPCIFEYVYFARPDSHLWGEQVHSVRQRIGRQLAREHPCPEGQVVIGVPDSSTPIALGFSEESAIPFNEGLTRNRYVGRTFIQPESQMRQKFVRLKYQPIPQSVAGKVVVLVDDSLVRGTTIRDLSGMLKEAGAVAVHVRIASPPIKYPCFMGINMKTKGELIANRMSIEELRRYIHADSLKYLSHDGLLSCSDNSHCSACFTGNYPLDVEDLEDLA